MSAGLDLVIEDTLLKGFEKLKADPRPLDITFTHLSADRLAEMKEYLDNLEIDIVFQDNKGDVTIPTIAIVMADDPENQAYLGDEIGEFEDDAVYGTPADPEDIHMQGREYASTFTLMCYDKEPSRRVIFLYNLTKLIMHLELRSLMRAGFKDLIMNGSDFHPFPETVPEYLYYRGLNVNFKYVFGFVDVSADLTDTGGYKLGERTYEYGGYNIIEDQDGEQVVPPEE